MLGASAAGLSRPARIALLAGIAGLTAASEKVSFTKVIARTPATELAGHARPAARAAARQARRPVTRTAVRGHDPPPSGPNRRGERARSRAGGTPGRGARGG